MIKDLGYARVMCFSPEVHIANPYENAAEICNCLDKAKELNPDVVVFPELSLTGYTCGDLFHQDSLMSNLTNALSVIVNKSKDFEGIIFVGTPITFTNQMFNCAVGISNGKILGIVPKSYLANYNEFYESRWFSTADKIPSTSVSILGQIVPLSTNILFTSKHLVIGVDICEDLWVQIPPSTRHTLNGANLIVNLSASNETVSKNAYRRSIVKSHSAKCLCAYAYCSAGFSESTTDVVFSGHNIIAESGSILKDKLYTESNDYIIADIDLDKIGNDRVQQMSYFAEKCEVNKYARPTFYTRDLNYSSTLRSVNSSPFLPKDSADKLLRAQEIIQIQTLGLSERFRKTGSIHAIIGVSGGLDSTLALLVTVEAFKRLKKPMSDIICVTMPCFGTSSRTYNNAVALIKALGCTFREVNIRSAVTDHLLAIGQPLNEDGSYIQDVTYENAQARERTQILMDLANKESGFVVGTGDLSELALGWCTYNGDHMSMYGVNSSIPKTLVGYLVSALSLKYASEGNDADSEVSTILNDIVVTPISPELLPPDENGNIAQMTEDVVGKYDLNDFFLYHVLRSRFNFNKIFLLASLAFKQLTRDEIEKSLINFIQRFYSQQFKRSCMPDGVKVGSVCLSPRGDWRMPSDISKSTISTYIEDLDMFIKSLKE